MRSFISSSKGSYFGISNNTFNNISSTNVVSRIMNSQRNSEIKIEDSVFCDNSAISSSIFKCEFENLIKCLR